MATINNGLCGVVSGRIGNMVIVQRNGGVYLRSLPGHMHNPKSERQTTQRSKMALTLAFLRTFTGFLRVGFQSEAIGMKSAFNAAMSYNMMHAVKGEWAMWKVDYQNVVVAKGTLAISTLERAWAEEGFFAVEWGDACDGKASQYDRVMLLAYNPTKECAVYDQMAGKRGDRSSQLSIPSQWLGDTIETYIAFLSAHDVTNVSESQYAGCHCVGG